MDWQEAKDNTLRALLRFREAIGQAEPLELLIEINAICDLCEKASAEAAGDWGRCRYCLFYQQHGGCQGINLEMSERIVAGEWDELRALVEEFIERLGTMKLPSEIVPQPAASR